LTLGDELMNDDYRSILASKDWPFLYRLRTLTTTASTQFKALPYDVDQVESVFVTVSGTRYAPKPCPSREYWDFLNQMSYTSDFPEYWFVYNGELGIYPTPATSSNTISINAKIRVIDLNIADYTTGTIATATNGSASLVGSGTSWTAPMGGRAIRITYSNTANTGDGLWYDIASVGSGTTITLVRAYGGTSIAAGSAAYTIGQMPLLPEFAHDLSVYYAAATYFYRENDTARGDSYMKKHDRGIAILDRDWSEAYPIVKTKKSDH
jgi:hypothetical protein